MSPYTSLQIDDIEGAKAKPLAKPRFTYALHSKDVQVITWQ